MKILSLPLFKEETLQLKKGEGLGRKTLSLPPFKEETQQLEKDKGLGQKNPLPSPIQCGWDAVGRALTDGARPTRQNGAWLDGTWPGHGTPQLHAGHRK